MQNFRTKILTYNGNLLKYKSGLSYPNLKVYQCGTDTLSITSVKKGQSYTIEINRGGFQNPQYIQVKTRKGVYACLTYYELLEDADERNMIIDRYGSLQRYFDTFCSTTEYNQELLDLKEGNA